MSRTLPGGAAKRAASMIPFFDLRPAVDSSLRLPGRSRAAIAGADRQGLRPRFGLRKSRPFRYTGMRSFRVDTSFQQNGNGARRQHGLLTRGKTRQAIRSRSHQRSAARQPSDVVKKESTPAFANDQYLGAAYVPPVWDRRGSDRRRPAENCRSADRTAQRGS